MRAGEFVVNQEIALDDAGNPILDEDGNPIVTGSACRADEELRVTLEEMATAQKKRRIERTLAGKANAFGRRLSRDKLEQRAGLIMRYKGVEPIWIKPKGSDWLKFKMCLDFNSPDMHVRCVDSNDNLHIFDPDVVMIATQDERTRGFAMDRQEVIDKSISVLREAATALKKEAATMEERLSRLEKETDKKIMTRNMWRSIESLQKDTIAMKRRATALEKRADAVESESSTVRKLLARAYSEELRRRRRQQKPKQKKRLSDFVRKEGGK